MERPNEMFRKICLTICFFVAINSYGQKNTIKVKKINIDTFNLTGRWISAYDEAVEGTRIQLNMNEIDTLDFYPNKKCLFTSKGEKQYSDWNCTLWVSDYPHEGDGVYGGYIRRDNLIADWFENGKLTSIVYAEYSAFEKVSNDTIGWGFYHNSQIQKPVYNYYYRKK